MHLFSVFSLRNRALIALVTIVIAVFGGITLTMLKQELIPSITYPRLFIITTYPGASPAVVEHDVSTPIENAIQAIPGLEDTSATSNEHFSNVSAGFAFGTDLATAEQKLVSAVNRIQSQLPDSAETSVIQFSLSDLPIIQLAATSDLDAAELSDRLERLVIPELTRLDGVASVGLQGGTVQRIEILPHTDALADHGITSQAIRDTLDANGLLLPAGEVTQDGETLTVQAGARIGSIDDIAALPILAASTPQLEIPGLGRTDADIVTIGDVAGVSLVDEAPTGFSRVDGRDALTLSVTKTSAGNTVAVSAEVLAELDALAQSVGGNTEFTVVFDQAPFITQSIDSLTQEGLLGLLFAVVVILIFLLSIRSTLVTAISIPTSVLMTFIGMWAFGYTLNIITLGGLTIAIGRVVDDSIVVIENIKRHLEDTEDRRRAILDAVREVAAAITASTVTTVAVFLPIALVGSEVGELFRPFAMTVTLALLSSLLVSLTIVPVLAYWFLGRRKARAVASGSSVDETNAVVAPAVADTNAAVATAVAPAPPARLPMLQRAYLPIIRWTLRYPAVVLLAALLALGGTAFLAPLMKLNFIGDSGQNTITVTQSLDAGASLEEQDAAAKVVEQALMEVPGVETVHTAVGSGGGGIAAAFGGSDGATFSIVTDQGLDQLQLREDILDRVADLDGVGEVGISATSGFGSSDVQLTVRGATESELGDAVERVEAAVRDLESVDAVTNNLAASTPFVSVVVDRDAAAAHGLTELQVGGILMATMNPSSIGEVTIDERSLGIYLLVEDVPATVEELGALEIPTSVGPVELSELATVERTLGPASITTNQGVRTAVVSLTPATDDVGATTFAVQEALDGLELPPGTSVDLGGVSEQMLDSFTQLGWALLAAILIVYVVMVATFRSLRQPLLLLVSVPFAATGAIALQVITDIPLGVSSLIGVLMLVGIVVTNAIVLVDLINQYRERGMDVRTAVEQGSARRLRPILMTAAATIGALLPLAVGITGHGGFISQPLAVIVIGGLVSSTLLTLIVLPTLYYVVEGRKERRAAKLAARAGAAGSAPAVALADDGTNARVAESGASTEPGAVTSVLTAIRDPEAPSIPPLSELPPPAPGTIVRPEHLPPPAP